MLLLILDVLSCVAYVLWQVYILKGNIIHDIIYVEEMEGVLFC